MEGQNLNVLIISTVSMGMHGIPMAIFNNYGYFDHSNTKCTFVTNEKMDESFLKKIKENNDSVYILPNRKKVA